MAIFIKSSLQARVVTRSSDVEFLSVEVLSKLIVTCVYLSPNHA